MTNVAHAALSARHHALAVAAEPDAVHAIAAALRAAPGAREIAHFQFSLFGVDESRRIGELACQGPRHGDALWLLLGLERATVEAQNALLKIIEDPPASTRFVLVAPSIAIFLPTIRSRLMELAADAAPAAEFNASAFLRARPAARMEMLSSAVAAKDPALVRRAAHAIATYPGGGPGALRRRAVAARVVDETLGRSPQAKLLCDYLALGVPFEKGADALE